MVGLGSSNEEPWEESDRGAPLGSRGGGVKLGSSVWGAVGGM